MAGRAVSGGGKAVTKALARAFDLPMERAEKGKVVDGVVYTDGQAEGVQGDAARVSETIKAALAPVVRELKQTIKSVEVETRGEVKRVLLCGGSSNLGNLDTYLAERLGVEVEHLDMAGYKLAVEGGNGSSAVKALALALSGVSAGRYRPLNFRKGAYAYKGDTEALRGKLVQAAVLVGLVIALLAGNAASRLYFLGTEEARVTDRLKAISKEIVGRPFSEPKKVLSIVEEEIRNGSGGALGRHRFDDSGHKHLKASSRRRRGDIDVHSLFLALGRFYQLFAVQYLLVRELFYLSDRIQHATGHVLERRLDGGGSLAPGYQSVAMVLFLNGYRFGRGTSTIRSYNTPDFLLVYLHESPPIMRNYFKSTGPIFSSLRRSLKEILST